MLLRIQWKIPRLRSILAPLVLLALAVTQSGCYKNVQLFRGDYEKYYRAQRHLGPKPIIAYPEQAPQREGYRYRLHTGDKLAIILHNLPKELELPNTTKSEEGANVIEVIVSHDGYIYLPLIPKLYVKGKVTDEVAQLITEELAKLYQNPVVEIRITNLKVFVFGLPAQGGTMGLSGSATAGSGKVVKIETEKTSLINVLGLSGGLGLNNKAKKVRILRNYDTDSLQVFWLDMRDPEVLKNEIIEIHANDIIYVETRNLQFVLAEVQPYVTFSNLFIGIWLISRQVF